MKDLAYFREEFENRKGNNKALAGLMGEMEREYNIPAKNDEEWNKQNQEVIKLYRQISEAREI